MSETLSYEINDKGQRILDRESKIKMQKYYFESGGLTVPFDNHVSFIGKSLQKSIKDLKQPTLITCSENYDNEIEGALLLLINKSENKFITFKTITLEYLKDTMFGTLENYEQLDSFQVLFVVFDNATIHHMYNAYSIISAANDRKLKGKYTFFIFTGTPLDLNQPRWQLDINANVQVSYDESENKKNSSKRFEPLKNYINQINIIMKGDK